MSPTARAANNFVFFPLAGGVGFTGTCPDRSVAAWALHDVAEVHILHGLLVSNRVEKKKAALFTSNLDRLRSVCVIVCFAVGRKVVSVVVH